MTLKILLVEDNPDNVDLFLCLLEDKFDVKAVTSAEAALGIINIFQPDILLCDIFLTGMDGCELMRQLRQMPNYKNLVAIGISAYAAPADKLKALEAGFNDYITKPIDVKTFVETIERIFNVCH